MNPDRFKHIYATFEAVLNCDPAVRDSMLRELCAGEDDVRAEVDRLLAQDAAAKRDRFLASAAATRRPST